MAAAAIAEAQKRNWTGLCIAIVGPSGDLVYFEKPDHCQYASVAISQHKARTAARYRRPTVVFERLFGKGAFFAYLPTLDDVIVSRGGNPMVVGGKLIGAIGVSGGTGSQDDAISQAGVAAPQVRPYDLRHEFRRDENPGGVSLCIGSNVMIRKISIGIGTRRWLVDFAVRDHARGTSAAEMKVLSETDDDRLRPRRIRRL